MQIRREQQVVQLDLSYAEALTLYNLLGRWDFIGILEDEEDAWNDDAEDQVFGQLFSSLGRIVDEAGTDDYGPAVSTAWQAVTGTHNRLPND